jgi:superoxide reductase
MRKVLFNLGLASVILMTAVSCTPQAKEESKAENKQEIITEEVVVEETLSRRDSLIINRQIMEIVNHDQPTDFELKHSPEITLGEKGPKGFTQVNISVGQSGIIHPVEDEHWIDFISLYADGVKVGYIEYEAGISRGYASFYVALENVSELSAEAGCNLHGIWKSTLSL